MAEFLLLGFDVGGCDHSRRLPDQNL